MPKYPFRNLAFEGGGVKGAAYVGAMEVMQNNGALEGIKRVVGASAGAINAFLFSLGLSTKQVLNEMLELNFQNLLDDSFGVIRDTNRLVKKFGWYKGDYFEKWCSVMLRKYTDWKKNDISFNDFNRIAKCQLFIIGANISTGEEEVYSVVHTGNMSVIKAVRISMSIPLFFAAVRGERSTQKTKGEMFL